jgi:L-lactate dehydrogenase (cytochrome)
VAAGMPKGASYGKWIHDSFDTSTSWKDIEWVRSIFPGRIILKGILDPEDAKRAVQTDIDGISSCAGLRSSPSPFGGLRSREHH